MCWVRPWIKHFLPSLCTYWVRWHTHTHTHTQTHTEREREREREGGREEWRKEMFYLTTHSTLFIYGYMASDIWLRTILIVRKETRCRHIGFSFRLTARVLLYAPSHRHDSTYHGLCYTSCGALAGTRNSSMGPPHEWSIRRPIAPWANALPPRDRERKRKRERERDRERYRQTDRDYYY